MPQQITPIAKRHLSELFDDGHIQDLAHTSGLVKVQFRGRDELFAARMIDQTLGGHRVRLLLREIAKYYGSSRVTKDLIELRNLTVVADRVVRSALVRKERCV